MVSSPTDHKSRATSFQCSYKRQTYHMMLFQLQLYKSQFVLPFPNVGIQVLQINMVSKVLREGNYSIIPLFLEFVCLKQDFFPLIVGQDGMCS